MIVPLIVLGVALVMMACEAARPGRTWPHVAGWWLRAALANGAQGLSVATIGHLGDTQLIALRPWSADGLGVIGGALFGYFVMTFFYYWWHRARHASQLLWIGFHQFHHSPRRIEIATSFYKHPFEIVSNSVIPSAILYVVVGLGPAAATGAVLLSGLAELFYHWNVATPWWLGFIVQRPEAHCVHHQEGLHSKNYGDLPIWDMLFGTFENPRRFDARCGFGAAAEARVGDMLLFRDVVASAPRALEVVR